LLSEISHGRFRFGVSIALFLEYREKLLKVVKNKISPLNTKQVEAVLGAIAYYSVEVPIYFRLRPNLKDENDNMVFECAANFGAEAIITHNINDFIKPELKGYAIKNLRPGEFLEKLRRT